ncbi:SIS domain-containing protein [uncultured Amnibacterium sp.]|uniref:SIS domain-containing protein n=1 Tax=uncultured Amnibacterium sp. TaxID=1631851 RepID=UPI0035CA6C0F
MTDDTTPDPGTPDPDAPEDGPLRLVEAEVQRLLAAVDAADFAALIAALGEHRRWFFTGQGRSGAVAAMAATRCMHLGATTHLLGEATSPSVQAGDGVLVVSDSGTTPVSVWFAEKARVEGASVVAVTGARDSPLAALARTAVVIPDIGSAQFGGSAFEQGALLVLDAAMLAVQRRQAISDESMHRRHTNMR